MHGVIEFTRCSKGRVWSKDRDAITTSEGYKIYDYSLNLKNVLSASEFDFINAFVNSKNESQGSFIVDSFEYNVTPEGTPFFCFNNALSPDELSGRSGSYIKKYYVGKIDDYAIKYMDQNLYPMQNEDYYYENDPAGLEECELQVSNKFLPEYSKAFYQQNKDIIDRCVSFLIIQKSLEPSNRKVLIIKDEPEEVLKWIACILYLLPASFANQITFNTNAPVNKGKPATYHYCLDQTGKYVKYSNAENLVKYFTFDLIGVYPNRVSANSFIDNAMGDYVVLDGVNKTFNYSGEIYHEYLNFANQFDNNMNLFNDFLCNCENATFDDFISLYEAFRYLCLNDYERWNYTDLLSNYQYFLKKIKSDSQYKYMINKIINKQYSQFGKKDIENPDHFALYHLLYQYADIDIQNDMVQKLDNMINDYMQIDQLTLQRGSLAQYCWNYMSKVNTIYDRIATKFFDLDHLMEIDFEEAEDLEEKVMERYLNMFLVELFKYMNDRNYLSDHPSNELIQRRYIAIISRICKILLDLNCTTELVQTIKKLSSDLLDKVTIELAKKGSTSPGMKRWLMLYATVIPSTNLRAQCQKMIQSGMKPEVVELFVGNYMEQTHKLDQELLNCYQYLYSQVKDSDLFGENFIYDYIKIAKLDTSKYHQYLSALLDLYTNANFDTKDSTKLLKMLEPTLPLDPSSRDEMNYLKKYDSFANKNGYTNISLVKAKFAGQVKSVKTNDDISVIINNPQYKTIHFTSSDQAILNLYSEMLCDHANLLNFFVGMDFIYGDTLTVKQFINDTITLLMEKTKDGEVYVKKFIIIYYYIYLATSKKGYSLDNKQAIINPVANKITLKYSDCVVCLYQNYNKKNWKDAANSFVKDAKKSSQSSNSQQCYQILTKFLDDIESKIAQNPRSSSEKVLNQFKSFFKKG